MGFFEDTKPPEPAPPAVQVVKKDWIASLIDGIFTIGGVVIMALLAGLAYLLKPILTYLLTFEGRTREQIRNQLLILATIILVPSYFIYRVPFVRDFISLKNSHTINITNGYRISFPDRSTFVTREARYVLHNDGTRVYIAYTGYTQDSMQKMGFGQCQMVPRSERIGFLSARPPVQAEGFEDVVTYPISTSVSHLRGWKYASYMFAHPSYWFKSRETLASITVEYEVHSSWKEFADNWEKVWSPSNLGGYKPFEVKALSDEHGVVCF